MAHTSVKEKHNNGVEYDEPQDGVQYAWNDKPFT